MNKFWTVLSHTYVSKLKSKPFIITTSIALVLMIVVSNLDKIIELFSGEEEAEQILVVDHTDAAYQLLHNMQEEEELQYLNYDETEEAGKKAVEKETYDGLVVIETDAEDTIRAVLYENEASSPVSMQVQQDLQQVKIALATEKAGVDAGTLETIYADVHFEQIALDETAKTEEELNSARGIIYVVLFLLYMAILFGGQMIATEVAVEKSSRVMEILISSAPPITHMFAKILGVGLLGLTQILIFLLAGYFLILRKVQDYSSDFFEGFGFSSTSTSVYIYAVVFFLLGYFLYATISAMLGSLVSRVEDTQQLVLPMIFLLMIAFFIAVIGLGMPDKPFITVMSYIPFFSPMIMFLRVGMLDIAFWEVAVSIGLLLITIYIFAVIGARIYRGGVLMYGASKSLKDIKQALQMSKKE